MIRSMTLLALPLLVAATPALASEDEQFWQTVTVGVSLPDNFKLSNEVVTRSSNAKGLYEIEGNLMLGYKPSKVMTLWLGYTHNPTYSHGDFRVMEHRVRQQVSLDNFAQIGKVKFSGRVRLEERWREGQVGTAWRLRPNIKAAVPFVGKSTLSVNHESFIDLNTTGFQRVGGYERMRNWVAVSVPLDKQLSVEAGYLNQHGFVRGGTDSSDHVLNLAMTASF